MNEIIQRFGERKSSNFNSQNLKQLDDKSSLPGSGSVSSYNQDDWENISESEIIMEGMDDPFKNRWRNIEKKYYDESDLKNFKTYQLKPLIVKANDDLRQEVLAM